MSRISRMFASMLGMMLSSKAVEDLPRGKSVSPQSGPPYGRAAHKRNQRQRRKHWRQQR